MLRTPVPAAMLVASAMLILGAAGAAQTPPAVDPLHKPFDELLDVNVRDGLVYYRALRSERGRLDRYVAALDVARAVYERWTPAQQAAYWLNAYNAIVLRTVIDHYPIRGGSPDYPASSIRQIPGAFERRTHRLAGRPVTLDAIEALLAEFKDPRLYLALGRGAVGSGRLRSEAYTGARLDAQLAAVQAEFPSRREMFAIDELTGLVSVTPIISWHEAEFVAAYDTGAAGPFAQRSSIERAILAFSMPHLLRLERAFVEKNAFRLAFHRFDWRLNDLTGGGVDRAPR